MCDSDVRVSSLHHGLVVVWSHAYPDGFDQMFILTCSIVPCRTHLPVARLKLSLNKSAILEALSSGVSMFWPGATAWTDA